MPQFTKAHFCTSPTSSWWVIAKAPFVFCTKCKLLKIALVEIITC